MFTIVIRGGLGRTKPPFQNSGIVLRVLLRSLDLSNDVMNQRLQSSDDYHRCWIVKFETMMSVRVRSNGDGNQVVCPPSSTVSLYVFALLICHYPPRCIVLLEREFFASTTPHDDAVIVLLLESRKKKNDKKKFWDELCVCECLLQSVLPWQIFHTTSATTVILYSCSPFHVLEHPILARSEDGQTQPVSHRHHKSTNSSEKLRFLTNDNRPW